MLCTSPAIRLPGVSTQVCLLSPIDHILSSHVKVNNLTIDSANLTASGSGITLFLPFSFYYKNDGKDFTSLPNPFPHFLV